MQAWGNVTHWLLSMRACEVQDGTRRSLRRIVAAAPRSIHVNIGFGSGPFSGKCGRTGSSARGPSPSLGHEQLLRPQIHLGRVLHGGRMRYGRRPENGKASRSQDLMILMRGSLDTSVPRGARAASERRPNGPRAEVREAPNHRRATKMLKVERPWSCARQFVLAHREADPQLARLSAAQWFERCVCIRGVFVSTSEF